MGTVLVTLLASGRAELDVDIPDAMSVSDLLPLLSEAVKVDPHTRYRVMCDPPGRLIEPHETLQQAGVLDGARLRLLGPQETPGVVATPSAAAGRPGWTPIPMRG